MTNHQPSSSLSFSAFRLREIFQALRRWPLGTHLLLAVNVPLGILLAALMVFEYRNEMSEAIREKESDLTDEAIAVHQGVAHLSYEHPRTTSIRSTQDFIDRVCAEMQETRSPGHTILVARGHETLRSSDHGHVVVDANTALLKSFQRGRSPLRWRNELVVLGGHAADGIVVVIAELATNIRHTTRIKLLWKLGTLAILALIAAVIVDTVLWQLIRSPLRQMSAKVDAVARGEFGALLESPMGRELQSLTRSFNSMSAILSANALHRRQEIERAREIQEHLLPKKVSIPGLSVCCDYRPADDVAGDYYDLVPLSNGSWLLVVADVVGHGVPAAMAAAILKALLICAAEQSHAPEEILRQVNQRIVLLLPEGVFVTVLLAVWHPELRRLVYVNAGHPSGLIWNRQHGFRELNATAMPVGIQSDVIYQSSDWDFAEGDRMVWFTDGVIEAFASSGEMFGNARLRQVIAQNGAASPECLLTAIVAAVLGFTGEAAVNDDLTLLVMG